MKHASTTVTIRMPAKLKQRLERLAKSTDRSRSFLALEAIEAYVAMNEWQISAIREGVADADAGRTLDHGAIASWLETWGTDAEGKAPE